MNTAARGSEDEFVDYAADDSPGRSIREQLDLQYYLRILRKHKWPISLFTAAITMLAGYYAYTATPIYSATSTLLIEQQKANVVSIEELYGVDSDNTDYYQTQFELLKSRSLAKKVIETMNLWDDPELSPAARVAASQQGAAKRDVLGEEQSWLDRILSFNSKDSDPASARLAPVSDPIVRIELDENLDDITGTDSGNDISFGMPGENGEQANVTDDGYRLGPLTAEEQDQEAVIAGFMSRLSVAPIRKTKLVKISYESSDPVMAARVANNVGEGYITSYLESKLELTTRASSWLTERLTSLKTILDESEGRLIAFKEANGLVDVDGSVGRLNEQELLLLTAELAEARSDLSDSSDVYREVQALRDSPELLESIPGIQADPLVQRVKIEQGQAQRQLDELKNRYGDRHPRVVDAQSQLNTLDVTLQQTMRGVIGSIEKAYQLDRQRVATIQSKLAAGKQEIQAIGTKKFKLDALAREVATNQSIYDQFFNRMSEAKSADGLETANARVSDRAITPSFPVKPKKQLIIALAALASLVLSMLMAFLYEQMDDTVKSTNDIEVKLGLKLLGILPMIKAGMFKRSRDLPLNPLDIADNKGTFAEAVNTARTAICIDDGEAARKIITITSSVPGEGKSTAAINLAFSLSQLERVLLIDCDMRRPTIAKAAGFDKNIPGLSNLITRTAAASQCIKRGVFDGHVDILPSGPIPEQPLELLSSKRFEKILEQLTHHYDRIVIDSAPTQAVSDALVLSKLSDAIVYIVKSHDTSIELVKRGVQRLEQSGAAITGVLMTQVDIEKLVSYGGDYYYQGYYDYYGYTEKGDRGDKRGKLRLTKEDLMALKKDDSDVNLDLDYGLETRVQAVSPVAAAQHGAANTNEFDLTMQVDAPQAAALNVSRDRTMLKKNKRRFKDDLDII